MLKISSVYVLRFLLRVTKIAILRLILLLYEWRLIDPFSLYVGVYCSMGLCLRLVGLWKIP